MKGINEQKYGKFKKLLKSKVGVGIICFIIGSAATSDTANVKKLEEEISQSQQSIETISKDSETQLATIESKDSQIKELQDKIDGASPWFDMTEEEREAEKERIVQAKAQKEEEERVAKEQQAQKEEEQLKAAEQKAISSNASNVSESAPAPVQQESVGSGLVISVTGKKYHRANCRTVKQVKQSVTAEQAQSMGYDACKVCKP